LFVIHGHFLILPKVIRTLARGICTGYYKPPCCAGWMSTKPNNNCDSTMPIDVLVNFITDTTTTLAFSTFPHTTITTTTGARTPSLRASQIKLTGLPVTSGRILNSDIEHDSGALKSGVFGITEACGKSGQVCGLNQGIWREDLFKTSHETITTSTVHDPCLASGRPLDLQKEQFQLYTKTASRCFSSTEMKRVCSTDI
jgi:hypothetical protein